MSNFFQVEHLIYLYVAVTILYAAEHIVKTSFKLPSLKSTPYRKVFLIFEILRFALVICAAPLVVEETLFYALMALAFIMPVGTGTFLLYAKYVVFGLIIGLAFLKTYLEWKHLEGKVYIITLGFAVPVIGLLYAIYTFMF